MLKCIIMGVQPEKGEKRKMLKDLQKASVWKRASAYLFDMIITVMLAVGLAALISLISGYDGYNDRLTSCYDAYELKYGVDFDITEEEYLKLTEDELENYKAASEAVSKDKEVIGLYNIVVNLILMMTSISILLAYTVTEFIIPLIFKNGQTLGKKIFGISVMRVDGVKISTMLLFIRTYLGKYTVETMIPVLLAIMIFFGTMGATGTLVIILIGLLQVVLIIVTKTNSAIHDSISQTVVVDHASQRIFNSPEEMIAYKKAVHLEEVIRKDYP